MSLSFQRTRRLLNLLSRKLSIPSRASLLVWSVHEVRIKLCNGVSVFIYGINYNSTDLLTFKIALPSLLQSSFLILCHNPVHSLVLLDVLASVSKNFELSVSAVITSNVFSPMPKSILHQPEPLRACRRHTLVRYTQSSTFRDSNSFRR